MYNDNVETNVEVDSSIFDPDMLKFRGELIYASGGSVRAREAAVWAKPYTL